MAQAVLYYAHDPMCSWCWGFAPVLRDLSDRLPVHVRFRRLLGGLAPDTDTTMPDEMQQRIQATWPGLRIPFPALHSTLNSGQSAYHGAPRGRPAGL